MELLPGLDAVGVALFHKPSSTLIIADIHIGIEEALNKQGLMVPRFQLKDLLASLKDILSQLQPSHIIINGDIKHEFGTISEQEWRSTIRLLDFLLKVCPVTLVRGNHDTVLGPIASKRGVAVKEHVLLDGFFLIHGHRKVRMPAQAKTIVIGHEHPAVSLADGARTERFKCFLLGSYNGRSLLVQPSFNLTTIGHDILEHEVLTPYLKQDISSFNVFIAEKLSVLPFGTIRSLESQGL